MRIGHRFDRHLLGMKKRRHVNEVVKQLGYDVFSIGIGLDLFSYHRRRVVGVSGKG